jgi:hypothetical protein
MTRGWAICESAPVGTTDPGCWLGLLTRHQRGTHDHSAYDNPALASWDERIGPDEAELAAVAFLARYSGRTLDGQALPGNAGWGPDYSPSARDAGWRAEPGSLVEYALGRRNRLRPPWRGSYLPDLLARGRPTA